MVDSSGQQWSLVSSGQYDTVVSSGQQWSARHAACNEAFTSNDSSVYFHKNTD